MELWFVLGMPLLGTFLLAVFGARRFAAEVNVGVSLATLLAASLLVAGLFATDLYWLGTSNSLWTLSMSFWLL